MADQANTRTRTPPWGITPAGSSFLRDLPIVLAGLAVFYGIVSFAHYGIGPMNTEAEISLAPGALPKYALFSVIRIAAAYALSLVFTLVYGYIAAYNKRAERLMIPLLDTLQSIPVLSFLPGVMVAMVSLFPTRQLGLELGSILLIFTGQVWNMTFSFYSSLKIYRARCAKPRGFTTSAGSSVSCRWNCRTRRLASFGIR
jgi:NitT/TauT family transport system permease protein